MPRPPKAKLGLFTGLFRNVAVEVERTVDVGAS
jgi:hypothetical protein